MINYLIKKSILSGRITPPSSKSQTMRAILFASLANGTSHIRNYLKSPDTLAMIQACRSFGAKIDVKDNLLEIVGTNGLVNKFLDVIDSKNSGQVLRFIAAISAISDNYCVITGDLSIRHNRVMKPLIDALNDMGAFVVSTKEDGHAPVIIKGPIKPSNIVVYGQDSQVISALIMASIFLDGTTKIAVKNPKEQPWVNLTLSWLDKFNIKYSNDNYQKYEIFGPNTIDSFSYDVPCDFSSLSFLAVAALITRSEVIIEDVDFSDPQGDKKLIDLLIDMNANIEIDKDRLIIKKTVKLIGKKIDANDFIDAVPILAVLGCFTSDGIEITNASMAQRKESNRLFSITNELKKMRADISQTKDGLIVKPSKLKHAKVNSYNDHRIAMSLAVAAMTIEGESVIEDVLCIDKSYFCFKKDFLNLGANIL